MLTEIAQLDLLNGKAGDRQPVPFVAIVSQPTLLAAMRLSVQVSGLEEKSFYMPLGLDKAQWSRIMSGQAHFPENKFQQFMDIAGNEIPLIWLSYRRGYDLVPREDAKDKKIRDLETRNTMLEQEIDTLIKYGVIQKKHGNTSE